MKYIMHGLTHHPLYESWYQMIRRCYSPTTKIYKYYGGRGIRVCEHLRSSPANLISLLGEKPSSHHTIDRPNNDGHYSCGLCAECTMNGWTLNVRWASHKQQSRNRGFVHKITILDKTLTIGEWGETAGLTRGAIYQRLRRGWSGADLLKPARICARS